MGATEVGSAIFLNDTVKQIQKKINNCFSGGKENIEEDEEYKEIGIKYEKGEMLTSEVKKRCCEVLHEFIKEW